MHESSKKTDKNNDDGYKPQKTPPLNVEVEIRVLNVVRELCEKQLAKYSDTLEVIRLKF